MEICFHVQLYMYVRNTGKTILHALVSRHRDKNVQINHSFSHRDMIEAATYTAEGNHGNHTHCRHILVYKHFLISGV